MLHIDEDVCLDLGARSPLHLSANFQGHEYEQARVDCSCVDLSVWIPGSMSVSKMEASISPGLFGGGVVITRSGLFLNGHPATNLWEWPIRLTLWYILRGRSMDVHTDCAVTSPRA